MPPVITIVHVFHQITLFSVPLILNISPVDFSSTSDSFGLPQFLQFFPSFYSCSSVWVSYTTWLVWLFFSCLQLFSNLYELFPSSLTVLFQFVTTFHQPLTMPLLPVLYNFSQVCCSFPKIGFYHFFTVRLLITLSQLHLFPNFCSSSPVPYSFK